MTLDIYYVISCYLNDDDFMKVFSLLSRDTFFERRRKLINKERSSKLLYSSLDKIIHMKFIYHEIRVINELLVTENMNYNDLIKEIAETLLNEKEYFKRTMLITFRRPIYINENNTRRLQIKSIPCCPIYRVPYSKKKYIIKHTPYAKALIY